MHLVRASRRNGRFPDHALKAADDRIRQIDEKRGAEDDEQCGEGQVEPFARAGQPLRTVDLPCGSAKTQQRQNDGRGAEPDKDQADDVAGELAGRRQGAPRQGLPCDLQEQIEALDQKAEGHHRDGGANPGEEGPLVGGVIAVVLYHHRPRVLVRRPHRKRRFRLGSFPTCRTNNAGKSCRSSLAPSRSGSEIVSRRAFMPSPGRRQRLSERKGRGAMAHGVFVDGIWHSEWYDTSANGGRFVPVEPVFRNWITADGNAGPSGEGGFAAERGRYHLYVSLACPYAHRTVIFRKLKDLESAISISILDPVMGE